MMEKEIETRGWRLWLTRLHEWRQEKVSDRLFLILLALLVGLLSAVAAWILHGLINQIVALLTGRFAQDSYNWLYLVYPVIGIYLTSLFVRHVVKDDISHGITRILYAISSNRSRIKGHNTWSSVIASAITIGFGGSVGAEAPIVLTGSAIGSNLGKLFRLDGGACAGMRPAWCQLRTGVTIFHPHDDRLRGRVRPLQGQAFR